MEWSRNIQLEDEILDRLRGKWLESRAGELHVSDTIYCLTKAYWEKTSPMPPTTDELLYFTTGLALEEVLLRDEKVGKVEPRMVGDMICSPDYQIETFCGEMDLKTTRMAKGEDGSPKRGWPDSWMKQFMSYAYGLYAGDLPKLIDYHVGIVYLSSVPPALVAGCLTFERDEVLMNLSERLARLQDLKDHLVENTAPTPFAYAQDWECKNCRYLTRCQNYGI